MPRAQKVSAENNFVGGLKTEFTGLNFPENACTDTSNCVFSRTGNVTRRKGFDYEANFTLSPIVRTGKVISSYVWNNADGSGLVNLYVLHVGNILHFFKMTSATSTDPLSDQQLVSTINLTTFSPAGAPVPDFTECQYATGNGRLFVFHPNLEPFFVTYLDDVLTGTAINIEIRDFVGVDDGLEVTETPVTLSDLHNYNITNQGWFVGTVYTTTFFNQMGFYPSNADVWWYYKGPDVDDDGREKFLPSTFRPLVSRGKSPSPKGAHIIDAFFQNRSAISLVPNIPTISTGGKRPSTGAFHAGRVFYAGVDVKDFNDKIYFSQIIESNDQHGKCYQRNDPTAEDLFDLLPSDGGVISIQDVNIIYKLFAVQNGLLVFASNGIWFITGSQGIGFTANDYTVTKISSIQALSSTSFVSVQGYPIWWNEEGIYAITPSEGGSLSPKSLTDATIASFFAEIPINSKKFARGDYNPLTTTIQWVYKSDFAPDITALYEFDRILNLNTATQAFYPWEFTGTPKIHDVKYIPSPGVGVPPIFKYVTSVTATQLTFSEERDETYVDWETHGVGVNYDSFFITGYKLHGDAQRKFQANYVNVFSDNSEDTSYKIQGIWNFANNPNSGKWTTVQLINIAQDNFEHAFRKHKIRGVGLALQFKIFSVDGDPFNIMGWSIWETSNQRI